MQSRTTARRGNAWRNYRQVTRHWRLRLALGVAVGIALGASLSFALPNVSQATANVVRARAASGPTLTIISPSSAQGPVDARVTISGNSFSLTSSVTISIATSSCGSPAATLGTVPLNGGGFSAYTFTWPESLGNTSAPYLICATGILETAYQGYRVRSSTPAHITVPTSSLPGGQSTTVSGAGFFGVTQVALLLSNGSQTQNLGTASPDGSGAFTHAFTPDGSITGPATITATSAAEGGAPPAVTASAPVTITPATTSTGTVGTSTTPGATAGAAVATSSAAQATGTALTEATRGAGASATAGGSAGGAGSTIISTSSAGLDPVVVLLVGGLLLLAVVIGVVIVLLLRPRQPRSNAPTETPMLPPQAGPGRDGSSKITIRLEETLPIPAVSSNIALRPDDQPHPRAASPYELERDLSEVEYFVRKETSRPNVNSSPWDEPPYPPSETGER